jgi:hypothetical protein
VGIYGDYFHLKQTTSNSADIAARVGTGISAHVKIEGEMASDFNQAITQSTTSGSGETRLEESNLLRGQFGPKLEGGMIGRDRFSWPKWNLKGFPWTRVQGIQLLVERDPCAPKYGEPGVLSG